MTKTADEVSRLRSDLENCEKQFAEAVEAYKSMAEERDQLLAMLKAVIADMGYVGTDGWMTGQVHSSEWNDARALIAKCEAGGK